MKTGRITKSNAASRPVWLLPWAAGQPTPGKVITFDDMLNCDHEFAPSVDKLTRDSPAPLPANSEGKYSVPMPGFNMQLREYL